MMVENPPIQSESVTGYADDLNTAHSQWRTASILSALVKLTRELLSAEFAALAVFGEEHLHLVSTHSAQVGELERGETVDRIFLISTLANAEEPRAEQIIEVKPTPGEFYQLPAIEGCAFHAARRLVTSEGQHFGTLIVGFQQPRSRLTQSEQDKIANLAFLAESAFADYSTEDIPSSLSNLPNFSSKNPNDILEQGGLVGWTLDPARQSIQWEGPACKLWTDGNRRAPRTAAEALARVHFEDRDRVRQSILSAITHNDTGRTVEFRANLPSGGVRWLAASGDWIGAFEPGVPNGILRDISDIKNRERSAELHDRELHHHIRNIFAKVKSILTFSRKSATSLDTYVATISGRLDALYQAHDLLLKNNFVGGSLAALVHALVGSETRIIWEGPEQGLNENAVLSLGQVFQELKRNATVHGSLEDGDGRVFVAWQTDHTRLKLIWREENASAENLDLDEPPVHGFGMSLIDRTIQANLGGKVTRKWRRSGLECTLEMPINELAVS